MRGDHAPAFGCAHPGLALPAGFGAASTLELDIGSRHVGAVGGDHGFEQAAFQRLPLSRQRSTAMTREMSLKLERMEAATTSANNAQSKKRLRCKPVRTAVSRMLANDIAKRAAKPSDAADC